MIKKDFSIFASRFFFLLLLTTYLLSLTTDFPEATIGLEPMDSGFADHCLTTWLRRRKFFASISSIQEKRRLSRIIISIEKSGTIAIEQLAEQL